ncbi:MAG: DUF4131 domain-containing protein [Synechococcales cyanobacterium RU_4_20]|nr:DUF4131 domain-containing protein [Synechococcales cyanobacterium RU_4_20]
MGLSWLAAGGGGFVRGGGDRRSGVAALVVEEPPGSGFVVSGVDCLRGHAVFELAYASAWSQDVSRLIPAEGEGQSLPIVTLRGEVDSSPRLNRSDRVQFWLQANRLLEITGRTKAEQTTDDTSGRVYVSVPLLQGTGLYPGEVVDVTGVLYKPQSESYEGRV